MSKSSEVKIKEGHIFSEKLKRLEQAINASLNKLKTTKLSASEFKLTQKCMRQRVRLINEKFEASKNY